MDEEVRAKSRTKAWRAAPLVLLAMLTLACAHLLHEYVRLGDAYLRLLAL